MKDSTALVIIDVQVGMFDSPLIPPVHGAKKLLVKIKQLLEQAQIAPIPVILVQHNGGPGHPLEQDSYGWRLHPDLNPDEAAAIVQKSTPDSFYRTNLDEILKSRHIRHLVVAGIQTEVCVDTTCRRASSLGYQVTLVRDAHSTWDTELLTAPQIIEHHNTILKNWFVELKNSAEIKFEI